MDLKLTGTNVVNTGTSKSSSVVEKPKDNVAVAEQQELVSKEVNRALTASVKPFVSKKINDEDKTFISDMKKKYIVETGDAEKNAKVNKAANEAFGKLLSGTSEDVADRLQKYRAVQEQDENISPMDFVSAQSDLKDLKSRGLEELTGKEETEQLTKLSKARHLLGGRYSVDFATEMVDLDATFDEYQKDLGLNDGAKAASRDTKISTHPKAATFGIKDDTDVKGLANLAAQVYGAADKLNPEKLRGYEVLEASTGKNGFSGTAFRGKDGGIVIAYRGSDDVADIKSDLEMINGTKLPEQFYDAEQFFEDVRAKHGSDGSKIVLTGHSLGGALSQLVAAHNDEAFAVTFNAPGTSDIIARESGMSDSGNIYNVIVDGDKISGTLAQPGVTQLIDVKTDRYGNKLHPHAIGNCT